MSSLTIYKDKDSEATVISNHFIDEYMKDANDAQLKIYLYLIRVMSANHATSISDIADMFNHTEKDVMRALKYWEKNQLLSLDFDDTKNLTGIHLLDLDKKNPSRQNAASGNVLSFVQKSPSVSEPENDGNITAPLTASNSVPAQKQIVEPALAKTDQTLMQTIEKPAYNADQLKNFQNNDEIAQLLFIAEQYVNKPLSNNDMKTVLFFYDRLGFSADLIDYLIQYCVEKEKKDFRYIEKVAIGWHMDGITTPKQAMSYVKKYDKTISTIMKALGKNTTPSPREMEYINKWTKTYSYSLDIITEACDRTVLAVDNHRFEYADVIIDKWFMNKVHHKADIKVLDENYQRSHAANSSSKTSNNKFNQFSSTDYDFKMLENEILSN